MRKSGQHLEEMQNQQLAALAQKANDLYTSGKYEKSKKPLQDLLTLQPRNDSILNMLAFAEHQCGNDKKAIDILSKALSINPSNFNAHDLMGYFCMNAGNIEDAEFHYLEAIKFNPGFANAQKNLGAIYMKKRDFMKAMKHFSNAVLLDPENLNYKQLFCSMSADQTFSGFNEDTKTVIKLCLEDDRITHKFLESNWLTILHNDPSFSLLREIKDKNSINLESLIPVLINPYFLFGIKRFYLTSIKYEKILANIRKKVLESVSDDPANEICQTLLPFIQCLGFQCWLNEYIYDESDEEKELLKTIRNDLRGDCSNAPENIAKLSILSCYCSLYREEDAKNFLKTFQTGEKNIFQDLITVQIKEPLEEQEISKTVYVHSTIENPVSLKVRNQYEENPYPRWKSINVSSDIGVLSQEPMNILIAGCGTGQEPASTSQMYPNAEFLCVDLSLSSLSYAIRQCRALNLDKRLEFMQADILQLGNLDQKFDAIYSSGVLHHMDRPEEGLKVLKDLMKPDGVMYLSLYSEQARPHVVAARKYIREHNLQPSPADIKYMRKIIINSSDSVLQNCLKAGDFYTLSQCRDFLFHAREHRFTLPQIKALLEKHNLNFEGFFCFTVDQMQNFRDRFPEEGADKDLDKWKRFEEERPEMFINKMYSFKACHKKDINH